MFTKSKGKSSKGLVGAAEINQVKLVSFFERRLGLRRTALAALRLKGETNSRTRGTRGRNQPTNSPKRTNCHTIDAKPRRCQHRAAWRAKGETLPCCSSVKECVSAGAKQNALKSRASAQAFCRVHGKQTSGAKHIFRSWRNSANRSSRMMILSKQLIDMHRYFFAAGNHSD